MSSNNKISNLISSQVPFFVRNDHPNFIAFLEAYYEWLEQSGNTLDLTKNIVNYFDVDKSIDTFLEELEKTFIRLIPSEVIVDKSLLIKHIKDFYRARGTEKATVFLLRILFGDEADNIEFYYPKRDVLIASDGKWFIEKSLIINDVYIDDIPVSDIDIIKTSLQNTQLVGNTSNATAVVERVDVYYDGSSLVKEVKISQQTKDFISGEQVSALFTDNDSITKTIRANTFSGILNKTFIINPGTGYTAGTIVPLESNTGNGGIIEISSVTSGNVTSVLVLNGGAGFQVNNYTLFTSPSGSGANAVVSVVYDDGSFHPNSYNVIHSTIALEANTQIGNTTYSNLNSSNANTTLANALSFFTYANTGPIRLIAVTSSGNNYIAPPTVDVVANTRIRELGILGRMEIISGGENYNIDDTIEFINVIGGYGTGASANVTNVDANGSITEVQFQEVPGFFVGGSGYSQDRLPKANVVSMTGNGANVVVTAILGDGDALRSASSALGEILELKIVSRGSGYDTSPTLNLTSFGDGTAQANVTVVSGVYTYPGRYINDDGHLSGYNFLQDRDYYQNYSYVIKLKRSINDYRKYLKELIHPAGLKLFGEYLFKDDVITSNSAIRDVDTEEQIFVYGTYTVSGNNDGSTIEVTTQRDITGITNAYVEFVDGVAMGNLSNRLFTVTPNTTNSYIFVQSDIKVNGSGNLITTII